MNALLMLQLAVPVAIGILIVLYLIKKTAPVLSKAWQNAENPPVGRRDSIAFLDWWATKWLETDLQNTSVFTPPASEMLPPLLRVRERRWQQVVEDFGLPPYDGAQ